MTSAESLTWCKLKSILTTLSTGCQRRRYSSWIHEQTQNTVKIGWSGCWRWWLDEIQRKANTKEWKLISKLQSTLNYPVLCGSAFKNKGFQCWMQSLTTFQAHLISQSRNVTLLTTNEKKRNVQHLMRRSHLQLLLSRSWRPIRGMVDILPCLLRLFRFIRQNTSKVNANVSGRILQMHANTRKGIRNSLLWKISLLPDGLKMPNWWLIRQTEKRRIIHLNQSKFNQLSNWWLS